MTDRALEWMSYRRSGKIGDLPGELIGTASDRRFVDDAVTLGHAEWTAPNAWQIAPPALAGLPRTGGVVRAPCTARTPHPPAAHAAALQARGDAGMRTSECMRANLVVSR